MALKMYHYKISFCVVAMNRLHHLKKTFIQNINDNSNYANLEFVLLDYNSKDGMEEWVQNNLTTYLESGLVRYYKTSSPNSWSPSHSKNIAFKLASGDIVCNIWADYYTGPNFASYVNECFNQHKNIVLTPIDFYRTKKNYSPPGDVLGKVCVKKTDFLKVRGFDEKINKHGFEDYDFVNRLEMTGITRLLIEERQFLRFVSHGDLERYVLPEDDLEAIFVSHLSPHSSVILILLKNQKFYKTTVIDNTALDSQNYKYAYETRRYRFDFSLKEPDWETGNWEKQGNRITTSKEQFKSELTIRQNDNVRSYEANEENVFFRLEDKVQISSVLNFKHFYDTRKIMEYNLDKRISIVNQDEFGEAIISRNVSSIYFNKTTNEH